MFVKQIKFVCVPLLCLVIGLESVLSAVTEPLVEIQQGKLKGRVGESRNGRRFSQYLGIPYAQKPRRFQEAGPPEKWNGTREATRFGSPCPQFDRKTKGVIGAEDCLFLNVYTPVATPPPVPQRSSIGALNTTTTTTTTTRRPPSSSAPLKSSGAPIPPPRLSLRKLPVLVYIHGGTFVSQSGQIFGAKYLMDEEVLLVTLNYRLGVLGFLSTGDNETIANLGLRDQILALKWIQQNIDKFGGDPTKVTLVGGSAGGALASYLMLSPMAKGLFSRVISQSGNALCPWVITRNPAKVAQKLATKLNCPTSSGGNRTSKDILTCIKGKGLKDIEIARVSLGGFLEDPAIPFAPVVEKWVTPKEKAVVPDIPQKLLKEGKASNIPWLTGYNSLNGLNLAVATVITTPKRLSQVNQEWNKLAPLLFHYSQSTPQSQLGNVSQAIRQYYFGHSGITEESKETLIVSLTDRNFISCTAEATLAQSKFGPVYLYTMNYQGSSSFLDEWGVRDKIKMRGVVHNDELPFLFNLGFQSIPELKKGDKATPFSEKVVKIWTEFAKSGKVIEKVDKTSEFEWAAVLPSQSTSSLRWYQLDSTSRSEAVQIPAPTFMFWEGLELGPDEGYLRNQKDGKIAVGYEMTTKSSVKPITLPPTKFITHPPSHSSSSSASSSKPSGAGGNSNGTGGPTYGLAPNSQKIDKFHSASSTTTTTAKSVIGNVTSQASKLTAPTTSTTTTQGPPPAAIHAVFKDDDPYSSTTTTTTKKPGFFSKIIG